MGQSSRHEQTQPPVSSKINSPCQWAYFIEVCLHTLYSLRQEGCLGKKRQMLKLTANPTWLEAGGLYASAGLSSSKNVFSLLQKGALSLKWAWPGVVYRRIRIESLEGQSRCYLWDSLQLISYIDLHIIYIYTYIYTYMCVCIHMYIYTYMYIYTWEGGNESQCSFGEFKSKENYPKKAPNRFQPTQNRPSISKDPAWAQHAPNVGRSKPNFFALKIT